MSSNRKVALITGSNRGIGLACAKAFLADNYSVVLNGRNEQKLKDAKTECLKIAQSPEQVLDICADLTDDEMCKQLVEKTKERFGKLDVLVLNHADPRPQTAETIDMNEFDAMMKNLMRSPIFLSQLCIPMLSESKGNIIFISTVVSLRPFPNLVVYGMAKAAMNHFVQNASVTLGHKGIRVNAVNPSVTRTNIFKTIGLTDKEIHRAYDIIGPERHPLGRVAVTEDIANVVSFLASDKASFVSGILCPVDGAWCNTIREIVFNE